MRARSPAIEAAMEVIGATVVAIRGRLSAASLELLSEVEDQADKTIIMAVASTPNLIFPMSLFYAPFLLLQNICNKG
jgi:hypothetical protein